MFYQKFHLVLYQLFLQINNKIQKKEVIGELLEGDIEVYPFFTEIIAKLARDPVKNFETLKSLTRGMASMSQFSTNKRLQLENALWNI